VSRPTAGLESPDVASVLRTHVASPEKEGEDLARSLPVGSLDPCHAARPPLYRRCVLLVSRKKKKTSAGHAVVPKEREPRSAPRSPPPYITLRQWPYSDAYPQSLDWGTTWDLVGQVFTPFSPGDSPQAPCMSSMESRPPHRGKLVHGDPTPAFQTREDPDAHARPNRDASRSITAWPLRRRPSRDDPGCVPLPREGSSGDFCTGTNPHR
jgi:hypothetical protein